MKIFLSIFLIVSFLFASNFSYGVKAYKQKDYKTAIKYFQKALEQDKVNNANYFLGIMHLYGLGTKKDIKKAEEFLKTAEKNGNIRAKCYLGEILLIKYNNKKDAKKILKEGLDQGAYECMQIAKKYNINL